MLYAALEMTMPMRMVLATLVLGWLWVYAIVVMRDFGTATSYDPPYLPTRCRGYNREQFPENGLFAAASQAVWDNGAACGRKYQIQCLSSLRHPCKDGTIEVEIVDLCRNNPCPAMLVLSTIAFEAISRTPNTKVGINFAQI